MSIGRREVLPLKTESGRLFTINREFLSDIVIELEKFLEEQDFMNNRTFSKKVLLKLSPPDTVGFCLKLIL